MNKQTRLACRRFDERFVKLNKQESLFSVPNKGWIRAIRDALGMSLRQLGERMAMSPQGVTSLEKEESCGNLTLNTLRKAAQALDCELVYALVPRKPLEKMVKERALKKAEHLVDQTQRTMGIEDQAVSPTALKRQIKQLADTLLQGSVRKLWDD